MQKKNSALFQAFLALVCLFSLAFNVTAANSPSQDKFIQFIQVRAQQSNEEILATRVEILKIYHNYLHSQEITLEQKVWLTKIAAEYKVTDPDFTHDSSWQLLLQRVDIIPVSLVTAQAINESSWGTSRFAKEGNNYFGQWCYSKGCGLLPQKRAENAEFEVRRFPSAMESVRSYMLNLNTLHLYHDLRVRRHTIRLSGRPLTGIKLVETLRMYSIRRDDYVDSLIKIMEQYGLAKLDRQEIPPKSTLEEHAKTTAAHAPTHTTAHHTAQTVNTTGKKHFLDHHESENTTTHS